MTILREVDKMNDQQKRMTPLREVERKATASHSTVNYLKISVFGSVCLCQMEAGWTLNISGFRKKKKKKKTITQIFR